LREVKCAPRRGARCKAFVAFAALTSTRACSVGSAFSSPITGEVLI
jgi:hypothetical protein